MEFLNVQTLTSYSDQEFPVADASEMFRIVFKITGAGQFFEFPFSNESLTNPIVEFATIST